MKKLNTGVEIHYDKKGNIKALYSPYYSKAKKSNPVRSSLLKWRGYLLKELLSLNQKETNVLY